MKLSRLNILTIDPCRVELFRVFLWRKKVFDCLCMLWTFTIGKKTKKKNNNKNLKFYILTQRLLFTARDLNVFLRLHCEVHCTIMWEFFRFFFASAVYTENFRRVNVTLKLMSARVINLCRKRSFHRFQFQRKVFLVHEAFEQRTVLQFEKISGFLSENFFNYLLKAISTKILFENINNAP